MKTMATRPQRLAVALSAFALLFSAACSSSSGGGGGGGGGVTPTFTASGSAPAPGFVRLSNPVDLGGGLISLDVVIDGDILNQDVTDIIFDVILGSPGIVDYVSITPGNALDAGAVTAIAQEGQNGPDTAVIVGVSILGGPGDDAITGAGLVVCTITLRVTAVGDSTLVFQGASCPSGNNCPPNVASALDSTGAIVGAVSFDGVIATVSGS